VFPDLSLSALLEELASPHEAPSSSSALALALAAAAAAVQKAARLSVVVGPDASAAAAQAGALRERAVKLADDSAQAYRRALDALADGTSGLAHGGNEQERRDWFLGQAVAAAAEPALALVRLATDLVDLCGEAAGRFEPRVQADVVAAAALAAGVARGARELVAVNLTVVPDDHRVAEASALAAAAAARAEEMTPR
jgi:formiminotetrahydrofolate cyclodeaminase